MNNKILLTGLVLASLASTTMAAGLDNTVDSTAAHYGAEAYGYTNTITATGRSAFVTGYNNTVSANNALAYGVGNKAGGINSLVGGEYSKATGRNSVAIGSHAEALQDNTFAIGSQARTSGENTVAIGNGAYANGVSSIVLGRTNTVNGDDTTVVGANNGTISAGQSAVFGYNNQVLDSSKEQLAFGSNNKTKGQGATVLGSHGQAVAVDSLALGNNTLADVQNSVALGTNSTTEEAVSTDHIYINGEKYDFAGGVANSTISIGANNKAGNGGVQNYKRTLTNVAAGRIDGTSTDAINGSQLNAVINALKFTTVAEGTNTTVTQSTNIDGGKEFAVHVNKDLTNMNSVQFNNGVAINNNGINAGNKTITNVAAGQNDTDAVNVSQLNNAKDKLTGRINGLDQRVTTNANDIRAAEHTILDHEGRITVLEKDVKDLDNKINDVGRNALERANHYTDLQVNKGVAKASALAGLKFLDYNPKDKWSFAASVGHYRNANAVAVGAAYQPNENTMVHGGITVDGKIAYNLGVSFKTGGQKQVTRHELEEQIRQLENNNIRMQEELNEIHAMLEKK